MSSTSNDTYTIIQNCFSYRLAPWYTVVTAEAQVSAVASFNGSRCAGQMVCPIDPLLFTCTVTESNAALAEVTLPSGVRVQVTSANMIRVVGATSLPD